LRVEDFHSVDDVVVAATDRADRQAVAAGAVAAGESDIGTAVNSQAVVLVINSGAGDGDVLRVANVEGVGVVAALGVAILIVDSDVGDSEGDGVVNREDLDGGVLDCLGGGVRRCWMW
jgi:hypothetical protein